MRLGTRLRTWALVACFALAPLPPLSALAQEASSASVLAARRHFEKARTYYGQGAYREAVAELEAAHALDPSAKDLVFNLGVVHEKLADIDEALKWFRLYTTMDLLVAERDRADAYIRRLEGAKKALDEKQSAPPLPPPRPAAPTSEPPSAAPAEPPAPVVLPQPPPTGPEPLPPPLLPPRRPSVGRIDGLTVAAASLSAGSLAFGVVMALKAKADQPVGTFVTGKNTNAPNLQSRVDTAHREAVLADVAFATALVSGIATAYLYFGRTRTSSAPRGPATILAAPLASGALLLVKGRF